MCGMERDNSPPTRELKHRQEAEEQAEREELDRATSTADAARHRRRADKAGYLRAKLEERERSERGTPDKQEPPPAG